MANNNMEFPIVRDMFNIEADKEEDGGLDPVWVDLAERLLKEYPRERTEKVASFRAAISAEPSLKNRMGFNNLPMDKGTEGLMVRFLRSGSWKVEEALKILMAYCSLGEEYQVYVEKAVPSGLDSVWKKRLNTMCEKRDGHGRRVYIFRLGKWDPDTLPVEEFYASAYVLLELVAREVKTQIAGVTVIADINGFSFKHIRNLGIDQIRCIAAFLTGGFPLWFRRIHVVHYPRIFNVLFNMMGPFLNERIRSNIIFHGSDLSDLHKEVAPEILPSDLGGSGDLDNTAAVATAKQLDEHYKELQRLSRP